MDRHQFPDSPAYNMIEWMSELFFLVILLVVFRCTKKLRFVILMCCLSYCKPVHTVWKLVTVQKLVPPFYSFDQYLILWFCFTYSWNLIRSISIIECLCFLLDINLKRNIYLLTYILLICLTILYNVKIKHKQHD